MGEEHAGRGLSRKWAIPERCSRAELLVWGV